MTIWLEDYVVAYHELFADFTENILPVVERLSTRMERNVHSCSQSVSVLERVIYTFS